MDDELQALKIELTALCAYHPSSRRYEFVYNALYDLISDMHSELKKQQPDYDTGEDYRTTYDLRQKQEV